MIVYPPLMDQGNRGRALRSILSGGWADRDADLVGEVLVDARRLAEAAVSDAGASAKVHALAQELLDRLLEETLE